jgi:hypothetical protein
VSINKPLDFRKCIYNFQLPQSEAASFKTTRGIVTRFSELDSPIRLKKDEEKLLNWTTLEMLRAPCKTYFAAEVRLTCFLTFFKAV